MDSDEELAKRVGRRDGQGFDLLMRRHDHAVRGHLLRILRDEAAAEDLTQEVFLRRWNHSDQWSGKGPFKAWLLRIATNLALNHLRTVRRRRQQPLAPPQPTGDEDADNLVPGWMVDASALGPDEILELAEQHQRLGHLLDDLPEEKRELLRMVHHEEMNYEQVAEALGIPLGTVKSRMHYTIKQLSRQWRRNSTEWENR